MGRNNIIFDKIVKIKHVLPYHFLVIDSREEDVANVNYSGFREFETKSQKYRLRGIYRFRFYRPITTRIKMDKYE